MSMPALAVGVAFLLSALAPLVLIPLLRRLGVLDVPNERSSHSRVVVRGVGLTVAAGVAGGLAVDLAAGGNQPAGLVPAVGAVALAAAVLGWIEDYRGLSVASRFGIQALIGVLGTTAMVLATGTSWLWVVPGALAIAAYINIANFMDGVNGISGLHGLVVGLFFAATGVHTGQGWMVVPSLVVAAAFTAFLPWNLGRGNVFLGDVGSYLLGASLAALGAAAFLNGVEVGYLLGPVAIYLADTAYTLLRRIRAGEQWWASHRQHVYQRLTDAGLSHVGSALAATGASVLTGIAAFLAANDPGPLRILWGLVLFAVLAAYLSSPRWAARPRRGAPAAE